MLPETNRLKRKKDFDKVFKKGKGLKEDFLLLKAVKNELKNSRFGFVVSRNVSKKATLRNRIKRKLRVAVKTKLPEIKEGIDAILMVTPGFKIKNLRGIEAAVNRLFKKANII